jgi:hypothetical protein
MGNQNKGPALVVLAAGVGSRYGGLKQMDAIGEGGEALLDYSVYDALRCGFSKIIFIIRRDIEADFKSHVLERMKGKVPYSLAYQEADSFIPADIAAYARAAGRTKPWGTAHALLCAAEQIDVPFCVLNADDFYSKEAFEVMGAYLSDIQLSDVHLSDTQFFNTHLPDTHITEGALTPYKLERTLSARGTVARGVCGIENGYLKKIDELKALERRADGVIINTYDDGSTREFGGDTPVSMNFWGFPPSILPHFKTYFDRFLEVSGRELKSECYLPLAAGKFIDDGLLKIRALPADADWFGVTYKEDRAEVKEKIRALTKAGVYPPRLWD